MALVLDHAFGNQPSITIKISVNLSKCMQTKLIETNKDEMISKKIEDKVEEIIA